jgi:hypothetical protein
MHRCDSCRTLYSCPVCSSPASDFLHIGVRGVTSQLQIPIIDYNITYDRQPSGIWHYAQPCNHRVQPTAATSMMASSMATSSIVKYNGGPLWQAGYTWQDVYWGTYYAKPSAATAAWMKRLELSVLHLETDASYSGGLSQYNVGIGKMIGPVTIQQDPPTQLSNDQIGQSLTGWISAGTVANLGTTGAYNIFFPPGVTVSLSGDLSCSSFCDYHDTVNDSNGPFYTVEPYPCSSGCNQCTKDPFDTLTQGLSEEMVELKTDMNPGTGWVIGNEEICDYCDDHFVCNRISTGEYVNAWYDKNKNACWIGPK